MKKSNRFQIWVTIGGFIGLLFIPGLIWSVWGSELDGGSNENRTLAEKPELTMSGITKYPSKFNAYWNDHVPFRNLARTAWANLNYFMLDDAASEDVALGRVDGGESDRWLFYAKKKDYSPVADAQGITNYSDKIVDKVSSALKANTKYFTKDGREFYMFVVPNKANVYKEYLPDNVQIYEEESRGERLLEELKKDGVSNIIYAKDEITKAKDVGQLYYKQDTHWNELGAFYGFKALMNVIEPKFDDFGYEVKFLEPQVSNFDLAKIISVRDYFTDSWARVSYHPEMAVSEQKVEQGHGNVDIVVRTNKDAPIDKTIMIVGDSYRDALAPYLAKVYTRVVSLHREAYKGELLGEYDPDIVVGEAVERYVSIMAGFEFEGK